MTFKLLAFCLVATVASVASARMLVPNPGPVGASSRPETTSQPMTAPAEIAAAPMLKAVVASKLTRPPVPLLVKRKPMFVAPPTADDAPAAVDKPVAAVEASDKMAKAAIEADGYKSVHALSRGSDGRWHAKALRGTTEVAVSVDPGGNVSSD